MSEIKYMRAKELTDDVIEEIANKVFNEVLDEIQKLEACIKEKLAEIIRNRTANCKNYTVELYESNYALPVIEDVKSKIANKVYDMLIERYNSLERVKLTRKELYWIKAHSDKYMFEFDVAIIYVLNTAIFDFALESIHVNY